jgi:hypothetical protein
LFSIFFSVKLRPSTVTDVLCRTCDFIAAQPAQDLIRGLLVMMTGKKFWMTSAAVLALTATANAAQPAKEAANSAQPLQLAQASQV